jgi:acyl-CoA thioesterase-1
VNPQLAIAASPLHVVALGDSLTAGYGLAAKDGFVPQLQAALAAQGAKGQDAKIEVADAGVSGDTASDGLARLDWSVPEGTDAVILELGANDMLRGIDPAVTQAALGGILSKLDARHIPVLLAGMKSVRNFGPDYAKAFDAIYPALASTLSVVFYPFFLDGVANDAKFNQDDGLHPSAAGVDVIVARILPQVETLIARVRAARGS